MKTNKTPGRWLSYLVLCALLLANASSAAQTTSVPHIRAWWPGELSASDRAGDRNGTLLNGATFSAGLVGAAFAFNGSNQAVRIPHAPSLQASNYSIEAWIRPDGQVDDPINQDLIFGQSFGSPQLVIRRGSAGVRLAWQFGTDRYTFYEVQTTEDLPIGQFIHVAGTWDGAALRLYTNGMLAAQSIPGSIPVDSGCDYFIGGFISEGADCEYVGQFFNGIVDELTYYDRVLAAQEVRAIYDAGEFGKLGMVVSPFLVNIDFGAGGLPSPKRGGAVMGADEDDFWNFYTRDGEGGAWLTLGYLANLRRADGVPTTAGIVVTNGPGAWGNGSTDPMYATYIYPFDGGNLSLAVTNLPAGQYEVLLYSANGNYELASGGFDYGTRTTFDLPVVNPPVWTEGVQFARFRNVRVWAGQPLTVITRPAADGYAVLSGMQILQTSTNVPAPPVITLHPSGRTYFAGERVVLSLQADGDQPLSIQWQSNGTNIPGSTAFHHVIARAQAAHAGDYQAIVTNPGGSVTSQVATLVFRMVPPCVPAAPGLISWWRFERDYLDSWGTNDARSSLPLVFSIGPTGRGSVPGPLEGSPPITVPHSPSMSFTRGVTVEAWIMAWIPASQHLVSKCNLDFVTNGVTSGFFFGLTNGKPFFIVGLAGGNNGIVIAPEPLKADWTHLAATFDGSTLKLMSNGVAVAETACAGMVQPNHSDLRIARFPGLSGFPGVRIDEVALYERGLMEPEIRAIVDSFPSGRCLAPLRIVANPLSQGVPEGEDLQLRVIVTGAKPATYQWMFNGTNIPGPSRSTLTVVNVKPQQAGFYSVMVSNSAGTVVSASAHVKVLPPNTCVSPLPGTIAWWPGDESTVEVLSGRTALAVTTAYATGKVGQAFSFGFLRGLTLPTYPGLAAQPDASFSLEGWVRLNTNFPFRPLGDSIFVIADNRPLSLSAPGPYSRTNQGYVFAIRNGRLSFSFETSEPRTTSWTGLSGGPQLWDDIFHHVAVTFEAGGTNSCTLYLDGERVAVASSTNLFRGVLTSLGPVALGASSLAHEFRETQPAWLDELTLYNRALLASEIQSIAQAGLAGKCKEAPSIVEQPSSSKVVGGSTVLLTVAATSLSALQYQWLLDGNPVTGATNNVYHMTNVILSGTYAVQVRNAFGAVTSSNALITVEEPADVPSMSLTLESAGMERILEFTGVEGRAYEVLVSTNLVDWWTLGTATHAGGATFRFIHSAPQWNPASFYRLKQR